MTVKTLSWGKHRLPLGERTLVMGILNVTPDSFSDGGKFERLDKAVSHARQMVEEGADIIDIGGESSRPFSDPVPVETELERTIPVIERLAGKIDVPISIDTTKHRVAKEALAAGASMVNDISAMRQDPEMAALVADAGVPVILMHMLGTPKTMQEAPHYRNVTREIIGFLNDAANRAEAAGIPRAHIIVDPGIGFGKTVEHNLTLIKKVGELQSLGLPILIGPSRKAFIRKIMETHCGHEVSPDSPVAEAGTQAAVAAAVLGGAHIVRAHDVKTTVTTVRIVDAIRNAPD